MFLENIAHEQTQIQQFFLTISDKISQLRINFLSLTGNVASRVASFVFVFILSFYLTIEEKALENLLRPSLPKIKSNMQLIFGKEDKKD